MPPQINNLIDLVQAHGPAAWVAVITVIISLIAIIVRPIKNALKLIPNNVFTRGHVHTLVTSGFVHGDWGHLFGNMLTYFFFAFSLQRILGPEHFLILYFASLVLSNIPSLLWNWNRPEYASLGASGAISGIVFSYILFQPYASLVFPGIPIPIPALLYAVLYIAYSVWASLGRNDGINHSAHLWGSISGVAITVYLRPDGMERLMGYVNFVRSFFN